MGVRAHVARTPRLLAAIGLAGCAVLSVGAGRADADVVASATVDPLAITFPNTRALEYRLLLRTGDREERFAVELSPPRFRANGHVEGAALSPLGAPWLVGPGTIVRLGTISAFVPCAPQRMAAHGYEAVMHTVELRLPALSSTTLAMRYTTGDVLPWPGLSYRLTYRLTPELPDGTHGTLPGARVVRSPGPRTRGRSGVRIDLRTAPRSSPVVDRSAPRHRRGTRFAIRGRLHPPLAHQVVRLRYVAPSRTHMTALARVRTDRKGRFSYAGWRPRRRGAYQLWAFVSPHRPGVANDYACPLAL